MMEDTFVMLKPDCMKRGLVGEIITRIERKGYRIIDAKMMKLSVKFLYEHYAHIADQPFFSEVLRYMMSGPVFGMHVRGENAVLGMRILAGSRGGAARLHPRRLRHRDGQQPHPLFPHG